MIRQRNVGLWRERTETVGEPASEPRHVNGDGNGRRTTEPGHGSWWNFRVYGTRRGKRLCLNNRNSRSEQRRGLL